MAQGSTASITGHHPLGDHSGRDGSNQIDGPLSVDLLVQARHSKPCTALVRLIKLLPSVGGLVRLGHRDGEGADGGQLEAGLHHLGADKTGERHLL